MDAAAELVVLLLTTVLVPDAETVEVAVAVVALLLLEEVPKELDTADEQLLNWVLMTVLYLVSVSVLVLYSVTVLVFSPYGCGDASTAGAARRPRVKSERIDIVGDGRSERQGAWKRSFKETLSDERQEM